MAIRIGWLLLRALTRERAGKGDREVSPPAKPTEERYWSTATRSAPIETHYWEAVSGASVDIHSAKLTMTRAGRYLVNARRSKRTLVVFGFLLSLPACGAGKSVDFLVLEDPASLEIMSRYEQPLTPVEKKVFLPLAPLKIVVEKTVLGDGITPAMEVEYEGHAYYLPRGEWTEKPPAMRRHPGCQSQDGEEKLAGADIHCTRGAAPGGRSATIRAGDALQAVFTCGAQSYVKYMKKTGAKAEYLWCPSSGPFVAKEKGTAISETGLSPGMQSLLGSRLESANATYARYTRAFNQLTGDSRKPPYWDCSFSRGGMHCRLEGGLRSDDLGKSSAVLVRELRNSLTGKPFDVIFDNGEIDVSPRAGKGPSQP